MKCIKKFFFHDGYKMSSLCQSIQISQKLTPQTQVTNKNYLLSPLDKSLLRRVFRQPPNFFSYYIFFSITSTMTLKSSLVIVLITLLKAVSAVPNYYPNNGPIINPLTLIVPETDFIPTTNVQPVINVLPTDYNDYSWWDSYYNTYPGGGWGGAGSGAWGGGFGTDGAWGAGAGAGAWGGAGGWNWWP